MAPINVLITGGNRGIGLGLVKLFLAKPNHTVIALVRSPEDATRKGVFELPKGEGTKLIVVKYDAAVEDDAFGAVKQLKGQCNIDYLDIVIANAAIVKGYPLVKEVTVDEIKDTFQVNVYGVVSLYQATRDLLKKSTKPIFAPMGSGSGALGQVGTINQVFLNANPEHHGCRRQPPVPNASYGPSKAALTWYGVRLHAEDEWLTTLVLDPGFVQTDGGNMAARVFGMEEAPISVDDSTAGIVKLLGKANREEHGGKVVLFTGEVQVY